VSQSEHSDLKTATDTLAALFGRLLHKAQGDPELAELLRQLAITALAELPVATPEPSGVQAVAADPVAPGPTIELASDDDVEFLVNTFASRTEELESLPDHYETVDLELVPERLRLKSRACRWLAEHGYTSDPLALGEQKALIAEGKETRCYLWMFDLSLVNPNASEPFRLLAANYDATAQVTEHWLSISDHQSELGVAKLAAQAQAALRIAVSAVRNEPEGTFPVLDKDQWAVFDELKRYSSERQVFLYGLALKDNVDPAAYGERLEALAVFEGQLAREREQDKTRQNALKLLKYHVKKLQNKSHDPAHDWQRIVDAVDTLQGTGMPESDTKLREALAPVASLLPTDTPHAQLNRILGALAEVEREKAARHAARLQAPTEDQAPEVTQVANLVQGRTLVIIGGRPNQNAVVQIETALRCDVDWISAKPHTSPETFKPNILKKDVLLVLLLIRWSSHVFKNVDTFCAGHGKYLIRVPDGYNVKKLASVILEQAGDRLQARK
jgi:hypothetical protein